METRVRKSVVEIVNSPSATPPLCMRATQWRSYLHRVAKTVMITLQYVESSIQIMGSDEGVE